jgi:glycosyltransferase involved in cell wall biosynthesis
MPKFSIILVSRNREELLDNLIDSIWETSYYENEVIVGCDSDADCYKDLRLKNKDRPVTILSSQRMYNLHTHINKIAKIANGEYFFVVNDDCVLDNNEWDKMACEVLTDKCYGRTYDDSIDRVSQDYAAFPIVSRKCYEKLGFLMDETYGNHGSDVVTYRIYKEAGLIVDLPMVTLRHVYHNSDQALRDRQYDVTATDMISRTFENGFNPSDLFTCDISEKASKLC